MSNELAASELNSDSDSQEMKPPMGNINPTKQGRSSTTNPTDSYISLISDSDGEEDSEVLNMITELNVIKDEGDDGAVSLQEILAEHVAAVINSDPDCANNLINVRRKHRLKDALSKLSKSSFIPDRKLSVQFADDLGKSEGAVDLGGPTREFLRLAVK